LTPFTTLSQAIQAQLVTLSQMAGVSIVQEDSQDISTEITKATSEIGMMVLLGIPGLENESPLSDYINGKIRVEILIREVPAIWRLASNANPIHCSDLGQAIAPGLQGFIVAGFEPLRVIKGEPLGNFTEKQSSSVFQDYRLEIETMQVFEIAIAELPLRVEDDQLVVTLDETRGIIKWRFLDHVTKQYVFLRVRDGQIHISDQ
jgi:hypothetical protein